LTIPPLILSELLSQQERKTPCSPYPADRESKTIALRCPACNTWACWRRYLSWEKALGIRLNEDQHPAEVDEDHKADLAARLARMAK
jgi:hypothetical protein